MPELLFAAIVGFVVGLIVGVGLVVNLKEGR